MTPLVDVRHLVKEFPGPRRTAASRHAGTRGRRRQLLDRGRRNVRAGRRIGIEARRPRPMRVAVDRAQLGRSAVQRSGRAGARVARAAAGAAASSDCVSGSVLIAQPPHVRGRHRHASRSRFIALGTARAHRARAAAVRARRARSRDVLQVSASSSAAASGSGLASPARSRSSRRSSSATSRSRRSTFRCRRRSSICCSICRSDWA